MSAALKLESFDHVAEFEPVFLYSQEDLDKAHADGLAEGAERSQSAELRSLQSALEHLATALSNDTSHRKALHEETLAALLPALTEIVDALAPSSYSARLERALTQELTRLVNECQPLSVRITCSEEARDLVEKCLAESGATGISITAADTDRIALSLEGGKIELSQEKLSLAIRELIEELKGEPAP